MTSLNSLNSLAEALDACRRRHHRLTLRYVLEAARILREAKRLTPGSFGAWLRTHARMDGATARRYLQVSRFLEQDRALMHAASALSLAKICKLASLPFGIARRYMTGSLRLSKPLSVLTDIQFLGEMNRKYPVAARRTYVQAYQEIYSAITHLEKAFVRAARFRDRLTPDQRRTLAKEIGKLRALAEGWRRIA